MSAFDLRQGEEISKVANESLTAITTSTDGMKAAVGGLSGKIYIYDVRSSVPL